MFQVSVIISVGEKVFEMSFLVWLQLYCGFDVVASDDLDATAAIVTLFVGATFCSYWY